MAVPNVHNVGQSLSWRLSAALLCAYVTPSLVLSVSIALCVAYNVFFFTLWRETRDDTDHALMASPFAKEVHPLLSLFIGDVFFVMMFWSFGKAMLTSPGYVPAEPWRWAPRASAAEQHTLRERWMRQQAWLTEQRMIQWQREWMWQCEQLQQMNWLIAHANGMSLPPTCAPPSTDGNGAAALTLPLAAVSTALSSVLSGSSNMEASHSHHHQQHQQQSGETHANLFAGQHEAAVLPQDREFMRSESSQSSSRYTSTPPSSSADRLAVVPPVSTSSITSSSSLLTPSQTALSRARGPAPLQAFSDEKPQRPASGLNPSVVHEFEADGSLRYCQRCGLYKPDRCHHCRACDCCVLNMDHHCVFLNNCVGRQNYKFFFLTITYGALIGLVNTTLIWMGVHTVQQYTPSDVVPEEMRLYYYYKGVNYAARPLFRWALDTPLWYTVPVVMGLLGLVVTYLWLQHVALLMRGATTIERIAQKSAERFLYQCQLQQYGRWAPETSRLVATLRWCEVRMTGEATSAATAAKTNARLLEQSYKSHRRRAHFRLLFGQPRFWWGYVLPLAPLSRPRDDEKQLFGQSTAVEVV